MNIVKLFILILLGFGSGVVISGGIYAFIAIIGIVPRMAQKTKTEKYIPLYEDSILMGGIFGVMTMIIPFRLPMGFIGLIIFGLTTGVFIGCLAVSIAEVIDVIPILTRRAKLKQGLSVFITALAIGKLIGALVYFFIYEET